MAVKQVQPYNILRIIRCSTGLFRIPARDTWWPFADRPPVADSWFCSWNKVSNWREKT